MSLTPLDAGQINQALIADAQYMRGFLQWANLRYGIYNQTLTTTLMNAAGIASGDQAFVLAFIGDLNRIITLAGGTVPSNADIIEYNINALLGVQ